MTEVVVIQSSSTSSLQITNSSSNNNNNNNNNSPTRNDGLYQHFTIQNLQNRNYHNSKLSCLQSNIVVEEEELGGGDRKRRRELEEEEEEQYHYQVNNFVAFFVTTFKKSVFGCSSCESNSSSSSFSSLSSSSSSSVMEIGMPTNVRHVAHVTFDRFNGFLGLPVEFEPEVPRRAPSASATVFGVSTNSMQLSFDNRGNSVPTILLMMQHRLYALGGLQAEGIFRINPDNGQEESVRDQLNRGLLPEDVDVHSLAGLIKAWFRELPTGVLDCLSPEQVMQSQTEQECTELARLLPPTEFALLDWAINLMADVSQFEYLNKMNARNIALVFAPNMTHMADPLTALMHAVQVMNFLKMLIEKTVREREDSIIDSALDSFGQDSPGGNGNHVSLQTILEEASEADVEEERDSSPVNPSTLQEDSSNESNGSLGKCKENESVQEGKSLSSESNNRKSRGQTSTIKKGKQRPILVEAGKSAEKTKGSSLVSSMNLRADRIEAWR